MDRGTSFESHQLKHFIFLWEYKNVYTRRSVHEVNNLTLKGQYYGILTSGFFHETFAKNCSTLSWSACQEREYNKMIFAYYTLPLISLQYVFSPNTSYYLWRIGSTCSLYFKKHRIFVVFLTYVEIFLAQSPFTQRFFPRSLRIW